MSMLRLLGRLSVLEWALIGLLIYGLSQWRFPPGMSNRPPALRRVIDVCALLALAGLLGGALLNVYWLSLGGVVAAALGVGLTIRSLGAGLRGWLGRLLRRTK